MGLEESEMLSIVKVFLVCQQVLVTKRRVKQSLVLVMNLKHVPVTCRTWLSDGLTTSFFFWQDFPYDTSTQLTSSHEISFFCSKYSDIVYSNNKEHSYNSFIQSILRIENKYFIYKFCAIWKFTIKWRDDYSNNNPKTYVKLRASITEEHYSII